MVVKGKVLLQLFNKSKFEMGLKRFYSQNFSLFLVKFKKLGFSARLSYRGTRVIVQDGVRWNQILNLA